MREKTEHVEAICVPGLSNATMLRADYKRQSSAHSHSEYVVALITSGAPDALYDRVGNIQLSRIMGASLSFSKETFGIEFKESWQQALEGVARAGGKPCAIPAGASNHPLGGLGFVRFAHEVRAQEQELGLKLCKHTALPQASSSASAASPSR